MHWHGVLGNMHRYLAYLCRRNSELKNSPLTYKELSLSLSLSVAIAWRREGALPTFNMYWSLEHTTISDLSRSEELWVVWHHIIFQLCELRARCKTPMRILNHCLAADGGLAILCITIC